MPSVFWIGCGLAALVVVISSLIGARSQSSSFLGGAAIGLYAGFMIAFPLLALGVSTS